MLFQMQFQYPDHRETKAQRDVTNQQELRAFIEETLDKFELPPAASWSSVSKHSSYFDKNFSPN